ncbi:MAG: DUF4349 domain-containing protein [Clostridiales bacterium]|jgi:hypothetical protein|nr:DUF4349 domain-containing protein [Clostridiales bacterium]
MLKCEKARELIPLLIDNALSYADVQKITDHIAQCDSCRALYEEMKGILQTLHETPPVDPPDGLHNETITMIKEKAKLQTKPKARALMRAYVYAAASAVAAFVLVCVISSSLEPGLYSARNYGVIEQSAASAPDSYANYNDPLEFEESGAAREADSGESLSSSVSAADEFSEYGDSDSQIARLEVPDTIEKYDGSVNARLGRFDPEIVVNNLSSDSTDAITHFYITIAVNDLEQIKEELQNFPGWTLSSSYSETDAYISQRVGIENFEAAKDLLRGFGSVQSESETVSIAQADLTELYARLTKKEEEKSRLLDILAKVTDLDVMLIVEQRLSDVNNEYDNIYTNMRDIANNTVSPYIQINLREEATAVARPDIPTFGARVKNSFVSSANRMIQFGQNVLIGLANMIVPLGIIVMGGFVCWLIAMAIVKRGSKSP